MKRVVFAVAVAFASIVFPTPAHAAFQINLGTAALYSVIGGQTVTNTGPSVLAGGVGVFPGSAITGFPPGTAMFTHAADDQASLAQADLTAGYLQAAGQSSTGGVTGDIVGQTFVAGVYTAPSSLFVSGTVTLDGQGDSSSVFIFQTGSTLITASASKIVLVNGALPCNVWWQVGSSATLGTGSKFVGTIMALTSITVTTGVTVEGRALARNGSVTLDDDVFTIPNCSPPATTTTVTTAAVTTAPTTAPPGETTQPTVPIETSASVPGATSATTTSRCTGCAPGPTTIKVTEPECRECAEGETSVKVGTTVENETDDSTAPTAEVTCIPKPRAHYEVAVGVCAAVVTAVGCVGGARLLRRRR